MLRFSLALFSFVGLGLTASAVGKTYEPKWESLDQRQTPEWFLDVPANTPSPSGLPAEN